MSLRTSATRYARALFDIAVQESDPARIGSELESVVTALRDNLDLHHALSSPQVPPASRIGIVRALAQRATLAPPLAKLLVLLAERGRLELLPELLAVYRERLLALQNIVQASVTSAAPLSSETLDTLQRRLSDATGKHVHLAADVDPALIGGIVTRIGSTVYDGSIRTQLHKLKQQLVDNA
jgi:F-type H+-transporting ATPase subunit delta